MFRHALVMAALLPTLLAACRPSTGALLRHARTEERAGRNERACRAWYTALRRPDLAPARRLPVLRSLVRCAHRIGRLAALRAEARARAQRSPGDAEAHYLLALAAMVDASQPVDAALGHLAAAERAAPTEAEYPYRRGLLLLTAERFPDAAKALAKAVHLRPRWAAPRIALARAYAARGRLDEARRALQPLPSCNPTTAEVKRASEILATAARDADPIPPGATPLFKKAMRLLQREFTAAAAQTLKKAHERYPNVATFALLYGLTMVRLSNYGNALALLQTAARLNPVDAAAPLHLASVLAELGRPEEAVKRYRTACRLNPVSQRAYAGLGATLLKLNRVAAALPMLQRAAALSGRNPRALRSLARALASAGRLKEAIAMLRDAVKQQPKQAEARYELAEFLIRRYRAAASEAAAEHDYKEARRILRALVKESPENTAARTLLRRLTGGAEGRDQVPKRRDGWDDQK